MLASVKLLKPINYKHEIVAKALEIDPQTFEISKILFTTTSKNLHNNQEDAKTIFNMFQKWQFSILQNTAVANVAKYLRDFFEVSYNEAEVSEAVKKVIAANPNAKLEEVRNFIEQSEFSMAIWSYLAKEWNITVSDEEVHTFLDEYYKNTNNSIREYKQDKEKFNKIKNDIELRKVIDAINNKFTVKLNINLTASKEI